MAVSRTDDFMLNTSCMLNFSTAIWLTERQKAFLFRDSPLTWKNCSLVTFSTPSKMSLCSMFSSHGILSSLKRPTGEGARDIGANKLIDELLLYHRISLIIYLFRAYSRYIRHGVSISLWVFIYGGLNTRRYTLVYALCDCNNCVLKKTSQFAILSDTRN